MSKAYLFLTDIEEVKESDVTLQSIVTAAVVITNGSCDKIDIKIASRIKLGDLMAKAAIASNNGTVEIANFNVKLVNNTYEVKGNGLVSIKYLLHNSRECGAIAIAQIKRIGNDDTVGYIFCTRDGKAGQLTKEKAFEYMNKRGVNSVQNMRLCKDSFGKSGYVAAQDLRHMPTYIIGASATHGAAMPAPKAPCHCTNTRDKANNERKAALLKKLDGKKIALHLNMDYDYDAMMFIIYLAKKHQRYDYLLNPEYTADQMRVIRAGLREGYDISQFNDPSTPEEEMLKRLNLMREGVWYEVGTSRL